VEPYKLWRWRRSSSPESVPFFTCARPGRSKGNQGAVPDPIVGKWVRGLPGGMATSVVSLLGRKPDGLSEFSFYSFCGNFEGSAERGNRPSFQYWLDHQYSERGLQVIEHPTVDFKPVAHDTLVAVARDIDRLLSAGRTVVLVDSGGETRTRQVCKHVDFVEDPRRPKARCLRSACSRRHPV
jgi:hypothetical protein